VRRGSAARAALIVSIIGGVSALFGYFREIVLAAYLGTSAQADALQVAMLIPGFFFDLLGEAALGAAVVPVFMAQIAPKDSKEQRAIVGSGFALLSLVLVPMAIIFMIAAPYLARLFAPGFSPANTQLTATLMRIMLPSIFFCGLANFVTGLLHAFKRFGAASATGAVYNLAVVLMTIPLANRYGAVAPAMGILLGAVLQLAIMLPPLVKTGLFPAIGFRLRDPALMRIWGLFWPILAGALVVLGMKTIDKVIASFFSTGSIAALNYADKISGGPARIFTMAVAVVLFPSLAQQVVDKSEDLAQTVRSGITYSAVLTIPWLAIFIGLREPIVSVLLQRGAFGAEATAMVAFPMAIYCLGQFATGVSTMLSNSFYSHHDSRTPTIIISSTKLVRVAVVLLSLPILGYASIAFGVAVSSNLTILLLLVFLRRKVPDLDIGRVFRTLGWIVVASAAGAVVAWAVYVLIIGTGPAPNLAKAGALMAASVAALPVFGVTAHVLGVTEVSEILDRGMQLVRARSSR